MKIFEFRRGKLSLKVGISMISPAAPIGLIVLFPAGGLGVTGYEGAILILPRQLTGPRRTKIR